MKYIKLFENWDNYDDLIREEDGMIVSPDDEWDSNWSDSFDDDDDESFDDNEDYPDDEWDSNWSDS